jgi:acyl carrier protein
LVSPNNSIILSYKIWRFNIFSLILHDEIIISKYNMERSEILAKVEEIFREELELDDLVLTDETTAEDVEGWDSLSHIQLVAAMEEAFGIEFSSREILSWDNVGDLIDSIQKKV